MLARARELGIRAALIICGIRNMEPATSRDLAMCIHPHPTLSESVAMAAEVYEGTITDLYIPKKG